MSGSIIRAMFFPALYISGLMARRYSACLGLAILILSGCLAAVAQPPGKVRECPRPLVLNPGIAGGDEPIVSTGPARSITENDPTAIRIETELVIAEFDVRDRKAKRISGLNHADFKLEEDGVEHKIEIFSFGRSSAAISRSIILVIDYSQSQIPYIETSVEAAKVLVDLLEPHDRMAIVTDDVELVANFTNDKAILKNSLETLKARALAGKYGMSRQFSALYAAVTQLFAAEDKRPVVIFQTDGDEFVPLSMGTSRFWSDGCYPVVKGFEELESALEKAGTTVYSIIPGLRMDIGSDEERIESAKFDLETIVKREAKIRKLSLEGRKAFSGKDLRNWARGRIRDARAVERISELTGGISQYLASPEGAGDVYRRILDEMNQRYLIGYYPLNTARDGKKRKIKVSLRGLNYSITGRTSYTPAERNGQR